MSDTTLPTLNVPLLRDLVTWAAADEEHLADLAAKYPGWGTWRQTVWAEQVRNGVCKSAYCIAGQAVVQVGMGLILEGEDGVYSASECAPKRFDGLDDKGQPVYVLDHTQEQPIPEVAKEAIGLTWQERVALFDGDNGIGDIVHLALTFAAERGVDLGLDPKVAALDTGTHRNWPDRDLREFLNYPPEVTPTCESCGQELPRNEVSAAANGV